MKTLLIALLLVVATAAADPCINDYIHFRIEPEDYQCELEVEPYVIYWMDVVASFYGHVDPITRLEFRVENWLGDPGDPHGDTFIDWLGHDMSGDIETGVIITFDPPLDAGTSEVVLAQIGILSYSPAWPGEHYEMNIEDPGVFDIYGQRFYTTRGFYTFNPYEYTWCYLAGDYEIVDAHVESVTPPPDAMVFETFDLDFTVASWWCMPGEPWPFTGEVRLNGALVHEFEGADVQSFSLPLDVSAYDEGEQVIVGIWVHGCDEGYAELHYLVEGPTAAGRIDFSTLKVLY